MSKPVKVLIVDDSALVRKVMTAALSKCAGIVVVGAATDPFAAREKILELKPDVLTLDIEMPRMDGLTFLKVIMQHRPMPVIIMSSLTQAGSAKALEALQAGAVDVVAKPNGSYSVYEDISALASKIEAAAAARLRPVIEVKPKPEPGRTAIRPVLARRGGAKEIILMGASTGGTEALRAILSRLPADLPGICIVQHIPAYFSRMFAQRLNELCPFEVREAMHGDKVRHGLALVAPGGHHMVLRWTGTEYIVSLNDGPAVHHQRPAVDVLFDSAVKAGAGPGSIGVLLTGMGTDGAAGLLKLRQAGALTLAQNEESCVVFGMPRAAIALNAADRILPLDEIAHAIEAGPNKPSSVEADACRN